MYPHAPLSLKGCLWMPALSSPPFVIHRPTNHTHFARICGSPFSRFPETASSWYAKLSNGQLISMHLGFIFSIHRHVPSFYPKSQSRFPGSSKAICFYVFGSGQARVFRTFV